MKKTEINKVLKENGYGFIKVNTGNWNNPEQCYTNWQGKRVKGIKGGSYGPVTVTRAWEEKNQEVISTVTDALKQIGMKEEDGYLKSPDGKIKLKLMVDTFPQYTRSAGYDEGYTNCFITPVYF
jgi:hypothetical protein